MIVSFSLGLVAASFWRPRAQFDHGLTGWLQRA
jgi:hypothetical protein